VDKAGFSGKQQKVSAPSIEDIPEALRDNHHVQIKASRTKLVFLIGGLVGLTVIALSAGSWYLASAPQRNAVSDSVSTSAPNPGPTQSVEEANPPATNSETLLGHFAYSEAPLQELQPIVADGGIKLRKAAATKFQEMVAAARAAGVVLVPISGFRSANTQEQLFFDIKAARGQVATKRASVSAPPGYSEHHTGYAVDIGDGTVPATNLNTTFEKTSAFNWLSANAARFSFEISFPKDNPQGVSYEPWHWRFVGDRQSLETFYKAKTSPKKVDVN
jgi:D-alanyl-D-alanine carboxypeptidase